MNINDFIFIRLTENFPIQSFDCGDNDLNDYILNDALHYAQKLLAVTYLITKNDKIVAFFSVSNDKIGIKDMETNSQWYKHFMNNMPKGKRYYSYPAVKIGRLGVSNEFQNQRIGTIILNYIKYLFVTDNRTGCMYITVDAYRQSLSFYEKNEFKYLNKTDDGGNTRLMYFPLIEIN